MRCPFRESHQMSRGADLLPQFASHCFSVHLAVVQGTGNMRENFTKLWAEAEGVNIAVGEVVAPQEDVTTGELKKLRDVEFRNLFSSPNIVIMMRWTRHVARMWKKWTQYFFLQKEKRPIWIFGL